MHPMIICEQNLHTLEYIVTSLQHHFDEILDSINLAKQNHISHYLLSPDETGLVKQKLEEQNIHIENDYELFQFLSINIVYNKPFLVFVISIPKFSNVSYKQIQIFPTSINQTFHILIPNQFLILTKNYAKFSNTPCNKIDDTYYCDQQELITDKNQCIAKIINNEKANCDLVNEPAENYVKKISNQFIVINQKNAPTYTTNCIRQHSKTLPSQAIIKFKNCSIIINNINYTNDEITFNDMFNTIPYNDITINNITQLLKLTTVSNQTIQNMDKLQYMETISIKPHHQYTSWGIASILITSIITYLCILRYCPSCTPCQWYKKVSQAPDIDIAKEIAAQASAPFKKVSFVRDDKNSIAEELHQAKPLFPRLDKATTS